MISAPACSCNCPNLQTAKSFFLKSAPGRADLETELFAFPGGRYNELADALSQAVAHQQIPKTLENYEKFLFELML